LIDNPRVELFGDRIGAVEYIKHSGDDLTVVNAARVSFGSHKSSLDERDEKLIKYLADHNHSSPFEHCNITFRFTVPLFIRSQHHRHRTWAYNEISRRYTSVGMSFYEPAQFRVQHASNRQASSDKLINPDMNYASSNESQHLLPRPPDHASEAIKRHHLSCMKLYEDLLSVGVCREQARGVLPQNLYTEYYGTVSLHNLVKFISLRSHSGAQWEIQQVSNACAQIAFECFPVSMTAFQNKTGT